MNTKFLWFLLPLVAGALYAFLKGRNPKTYEEYCDLCKSAARDYLLNHSAQKSVLTLVLISDLRISAVLYYKQEDGKTMKVKLPVDSFSLDNCPSDVQDKIKNGEFVLATF